MFRKFKRVICLIAGVSLLAGCGSKGRIIDAAASRELDVFIILQEEVPLSPGPSTAYCLEVFNIINEYRAEQGKSALKWSPDLVPCAEVRAQEIAINWSHTRPNGQPWYTVNPNIMYGENLAKNYSTPEELVKAWKNSPTHNDNLLYSDFIYVAIVLDNGYVACEFA